MFEKTPQKRHKIVVVTQAAALTGVCGTVVAAEGTAEGVDENGRTLLAEEPVVTIRGVVAAAYLRRIMALVVELFQQVDIRLRLRSVGVDHHQSLIAATEQINIHQELYLVQFNQWNINKVATADESTFLASEEEEDVGVFKWLSG